VRIRFGVVALGLIAIIGFDLSDAGCDPLGIAGGRPIVSPAPERPADPCSESCIPDCFCCSSTILAVPAVLNGPLEALPGVPVTALPRLTPGTPPVQDHVPKSIL
jgi:hypothetical protein